MLALAAAVLAGALASPGPAAAAKPCAEQLLDDWLDGRIDGVYPARCYREAIKILPEDVEAYSDAREDIERALLGSIRDADGLLGPEDPVAPQPDPGSPTDGSPGEGEAAPGASGNGGPDAGDGLIGAFGPSNAASVPIPLLVLAGLAAALLAAGSAGFVARRIQARRVRVTPSGGGGERP